MLVNNSKIIVIKLGSSTVVDGKGKFKTKWVTSLVKDIKKFGRNKNFVIVSSGAIALGQKYLRIKQKRIKLEMRQAIAAVGQIHLSGEFQKLFDKYKIKEYVGILNKLRELNISSEIYPGEAKLKKQMEYANKLGSPAVILYGDNEIKSGKVTLKNLESGNESSIKIVELANEIKKLL